ncbi:MAG TPA: translation initiation factor IF-6 [Thermoplasmata archaeon]|nr:translation initiation factor IF-6 [Thermoplasmata archaeon]
MLKKWSISGNSYVGVYTFCSNDFVLLPLISTEKDKEHFVEALECEAVFTNIGGSTILGSLCAGNDHGVLLTNFAEEEDINLLKKWTNVARIDDRLNAIGNLVLANNRAAVVHPELSKHTVKLVEEMLDVEVYKGTIAGKGNVGMLGCATDRGVLLHPKVREDEIRLLKNAFGDVEIDIGTVNYGSPYIGAAMVANKHGAVVGLETTGVELNRIEHTLGYL